MIDLKTTRTGEYVVVTSAFHDYGKVGTVFRIINTEIPGEATAAVGWMVSQETGLIDNARAYKIPGDKVDKMPRKDLAAILRKGLKKLDNEVRAAERNRNVVRDRINNLESYYSQEQEFKDTLESIFSFL